MNLIDIIIKFILIPFGFFSGIYLVIEGIKNGWYFGAFCIFGMMIILLLLLLIPVFYPGG